MRNFAASRENQPVVVGVDGTRTAGVTVDLAVAFAVRYRAPLAIVHVWPGRYLGSYGSRGAFPGPADGQRLLEVAARRAQLTEPQLPVSTELLDGGAASVLTERSREARLMVVGQCDDVLARTSWGSTTAYLAHHSAAPLLVRRGAQPHDGPVVVAVSARPTGAATVGYAFHEASLRNNRLVAVHMWTRPVPSDGSAPVVPAAGYVAERAQADAVLAETLASWSARFPDVRVDRLVVHDLELTYTIERASRRGSLLVAGIGRHGRFAEVLYGSIGAGPAAARRATCPVLLVPAGYALAERSLRSDDPAKPLPR